MVDVDPGSPSFSQVVSRTEVLAMMRKNSLSNRETALQFNLTRARWLTCTLLMDGSYDELLSRIRSCSSRARRDALSAEPDITLSEERMRYPPLLLALLLAMLLKPFAEHFPSFPLCSRPELSRFQNRSEPHFAGHHTLVGISGSPQWKSFNHRPHPIGRREPERVL